MTGTWLKLIMEWPAESRHKDRLSSLRLILILVLFMAESFTKLTFWALRPAYCLWCRSTALLHLGYYRRTGRNC